MSLILDALRKAQEERKAIYVKEEGRRHINLRRPRKTFYFILGGGLCLGLLIFLLPVPKKTGPDYTKITPIAHLEKPMMDAKNNGEKNIEKRTRKSEAANTIVAKKDKAIKPAVETKKDTPLKEAKEVKETHRMDKPPEPENIENSDVMVKTVKGDRITDLYNKAVLETQKGNLDLAKEMYLKILKEKPDYIEVLNNLGVIALTQGNPKEAIFYYRKILERSPNYPKAYNNMAIAILKEGDKRLAEEYFKKAIEIDKEGIEAYINLSGLLCSEKRLKEAAMVLEPVIKKGSETPDLYLSYAIIMDELGNIKEATFYYRYYLRLSGKSEERNKVIERLKALEDREFTKNP
ncbi:MAG TPA: tetratricopeptide repeat protein [Syntrophorhabdaceae bacterium]|nr:tetratricopeptide repeat protein [Syntrophorhabdaceae bacterium]